MSSRLEPPRPALHGAEGELVLVRILVEPRSLERTLETLARLSFPINPQICHDAVRTRGTADGAGRAEAVAAIEFPAWTDKLDEVREALREQSLDSAALHVGSMWSAVRRPGAGGQAGAEPPLLRTA